MKATMTNSRIKRVFERSVERVKNKQTPNVSGIMREEGYSVASAHALTVKRSKTWDYLLAQIDDNIILERVYRVLGSGDNRAALSAAELLFRLKDRMPSGKLRITAFNEELNKIRDDT